MKKFYIYKTTNIITHKFYIGMHRTDNMNDGYLGSGVILKRSLKKYGKENHIKEILSYHESFIDLCKAEQLIINEEMLKKPLRDQEVKLIIGKYVNICPLKPGLMYLHFMPPFIFLNLLMYIS